MLAMPCGCLTDVKTADSNTKYASDALKEYVADGRLPGAISVFYDNGVQETCCIGYADVAAKRPISMNDVFMQCSQTKGFCGVTIAKLIEEGRIALDDPVSRYLPEFSTLWILGSDKGEHRVLRKAKNVLTLRQILNHTGGFPFEISAKDGNLRGGGWTGGAPIRQVAAIAANSPLLFEPGTQVQYSNTGIDVAAAVVEVVTGMHWEDYLQKAVLDPLEMRDTCFWPSNEQLRHQIELYGCRTNGPAIYLREYCMEQRPYNDRSRVFASAGAGLWTTANDQLKFYKMLMNLGLGENGVRILQEHTVVNLLAKATRPSALVDSNYSLGFRAPSQDGEDEWFGHGGAMGTSCMVNWHKKQLKLWVVQLRGNPRPWDKARDDAANAFFKTRLDVSGERAYTDRTK